MGIRGSASQPYPYRYDKAIWMDHSLSADSSFRFFSSSSAFFRTSSSSCSLAASASAHFRASSFLRVLSLFCNLSFLAASASIYYCFSCLASLARAACNFDSDTVLIESASLSSTSVSSDLTWICLSSRSNLRRHIACNYRITKHSQSILVSLPFNP